MNHIVYDEIAYFQHEPTPAEVMSRFAYWEPPANTHTIGVEAHTWSKANAEYQRIRAKREKERANCLHGQRPFPLRWKVGTHPFGARDYWVNIEGMSGGPYLLSESDHDILHQARRTHSHVQ